VDDKTLVSWRHEADGAAITSKPHTVETRPADSEQIQRRAPPNSTLKRSSGFDLSAESFEFSRSFELSLLPSES